KNLPTSLNAINDGVVASSGNVTDLTKRVDKLTTTLDTLSEKLNEQSQKVDKQLRLSKAQRYILLFTIAVLLAIIGYGGYQIYQLQNSMKALQGEMKRLIPADTPTIPPPAYKTAPKSKK